jgi:hypothetical protein
VKIINNNYYVLAARYMLANFRVQKTNYAIEIVQLFYYKFR